LTRILALDYGERAIGAAISDELGVTAQGLDTIRRDPAKKKWSFMPQIVEIVEKYNVSTIILGYPINKNYTIGQQAEKTLEFKELLLKTFPAADIILKDERFTTAIASRVLLEADISRKRRGQVVDRMAAVIILQNYLDEIYYKKKEAVSIKKDEDNNDFGMEDSIIRIKDDNGVEIEFCVVDELERNGVRYMLVVETDLIDDDEAEAVIFKEVGGDKDEMVFEELDDDEFEEVAKLFDARLEDYDIEF